MITYIKPMKKIFLVFILLFSLDISASFFGTIKASFYEQKADSYFNKKKYNAAYENYISASKNDSGYGYFKLYVMNKNGLGRAKNQKLAFKMLKKSANLHCPMAEVILANRLLYRKKSYTKEAIKLLKSAAKKEFVYAYVDLYNIYKYGIGVRKNATKANQYYRLAKANGYDFKKRKLVKRKYSKNKFNKKLIIQIQKGLKKLGFYRSKVDGISGPMTRRSIASFQKYYGYDIDSKVSKKTLEQINSELK
jgi:TPR repeat protein